jgi:fatty acid hydroxylase domain-containing protein 2
VQPGYSLPSDIIFVSFVMQMYEAEKKGEGFLYIIIGLFFLLVDEMDMFYVHLFLYWSISLGCYCLDTFLSYKGTLQLYKLKGHPPTISWQLWIQAVPLVLFNQLCITWVYFTFVLPYIPTASVWTTPLRWIVFLGIEEVGFYYIHRLLHHRRLYPLIHAIHHQWLHPQALVANYAHPIEHLLNNLVPMTLGPLLVGASQWDLCLWISLGTVSSVLSHSGYHWMWVGADFHDLHHQFRNIHFGVLGVLDRWHGTTLAAKWLPHSY